MRIIIIYLLGAFLITGCILKNTPDTVKKNFEEKYPDAKDVSWGVDKNALREAHFKLDGEKYRADFTLSGKWVETEKNVKWDEMPEAVKNKFEEIDKKKDVVEIELVDHFEKGVFYDIEYFKGDHKQDVMIRPNGDIISIQNN